MHSVSHPAKAASAIAHSALRSVWARRVVALCGGCWGLGAALAAEPVRVLTEKFPPYNDTDQGRVTGLGTEVVEAVLKELGLQGQSLQSSVRNGTYARNQRKWQ